MVNPGRERSRLGELLLEMRLVDEESITAALAEHRVSGRRLPRILADKRVLDEERLAKAVAARLGLEAVSVGTLKIHERVLGLVPAGVAMKHGVLPIAIKRTNQAEVLYLVMSDPLDTEAIGEVQRLSGRQVRVLMSTASEVDHAIDVHYRNRTPAPATTPAPRPAALATRPPVTSPRATLPPPAPSSPPPLPSFPRGDGPPPSRGSVTPSPGSERRRPPSIASAPLPRSFSQPGLPPSVQVVRGTPASDPPRPLSERPVFDPSRPPELRRITSSNELPKPDAPGAKSRPPDRTVEGAAEGSVRSRPPEGSGPRPAPLSHPADSDLVFPSELDPPDSVNTRIDPGPFSRLEGGERGSQPGQLRGLVDHDWDLAVRDWESGEGQWSNPPAGTKPRDGLGDPAGAMGEGKNLDEVTREALLADFEDQWSQGSALTHTDSDALEAHGPEDIATSQLELGELSAEDFRRELVRDAAAHRGAGAPSPTPPKPTAPKPTAHRELASTLEVPVPYEDHQNPFDGPGPDEVPTGLDKTGIFPSMGLELDEFVPPPLEAHSTGRAWDGGSDIPLSSDAVRERFIDLPSRAEPERDDIAVIEEVPLEPLEAQELVELEDLAPELHVEDLGEDEPLPLEEVFASAEVRDTHEALPPLEDSDADRMPVIEPSTLASFMDGDADSLAAEDTGADERPYAAPEPAPPPTRVFDEENRQVVHAERPRRTQSEDEPTNPRIDTAEVKAALDEPAPREAPERGRAELGRLERGSSMPAEGRDAGVPERGRAEQGRLERGASMPAEGRDAVESPPKPASPILPPRTLDKPLARDVTISDASKSDAEVTPPARELPLRPGPVLPPLARATEGAALARDGGALPPKKAPSGPVPAPFVRPAAPPMDVPPEEEPTPARDAVDRNAVMSALDDAFWRTSGKVEAEAPRASEPVDDVSRDLVEALMSGSSLSSAERAQLLLAVARALVSKGILSREALAAELER